MVAMVISESWSYLVVFSFCLTHPVLFKYFQFFKTCLKLRKREFDLSTFFCWPNKRFISQVKKQQQIFVLQSSKFSQISKSPEAIPRTKGRLSRSAHRTTNFTNSEFQFPHFKVLQSVLFFVSKELYWHFLMYFGLDLKLLSCQYLLTK